MFLPIENSGLRKIDSPVIKTSWNVVFKFMANQHPGCWFDFGWGSFAFALKRYSPPGDYDFADMGNARFAERDYKSLIGTLIYPQNALLEGRGLQFNFPFVVALTTPHQDKGRWRLADVSQRHHSDIRLDYDIGEFLFATVSPGVPKSEYRNTGSMKDFMSYLYHLEIMLTKFVMHPDKDEINKWIERILEGTLNLTGLRVFEDKMCLKYGVSYRRKDTVE